MAKLGTLMLNEGSWQGRQIVAADWIKKTITPHNEGYGYQWNIEDNGYYVSGRGDVIIKVFPQSNMTIVATAEETTDLKQLIEDFASSVGKADKSLPPNPEANEKLAELLNQFENPKAQEVASPPATAAEVSGNTYQLQSNPLISSLKFEFGEKDAAYVTITGAEENEIKKSRIKIGLDGVYRFSDYYDTHAGLYKTHKVAAKGKWTGENTFVYNMNYMGETEFYNKVIFDNGEIEFIMENLASGRGARFLGTVKE
jgi:hypothetical protein